MLGFREKHTQVAELRPVLPKTMLWTFTAVPRSPLMSLISRYLHTRGLFQLPNTAVIAWGAARAVGRGKSLGTGAKKKLNRVGNGEEG